MPGAGIREGRGGRGCSRKSVAYSAHLKTNTYRIYVYATYCFLLRSSHLRRKQRTFARTRYVLQRNTSGFGLPGELNGNGARQHDEDNLGTDDVTKRESKFRSRCFGSPSGVRKVVFDQKSITFFWVRETPTAPLIRICQGAKWQNGRAFNTATVQSWLMSAPGDAT